MRLTLPPSLHYPITVKELLKQPNDHVERSAPLFAYTYNTTVTETNRDGEEFQVERSYPSRFESSVEGTLKDWMLREGDVIARPNHEVAEIEEPCTHSVQFGGMCVNCGKDMTEQSYVTTQPDAKRAKINMVHDNVALTVSHDEALRVELEAKRRLIGAKKLSLVVDLDQTIIHATVDPTVAEWQKDPDNPNYDAVKDVQAFQLTDEGPGGKGTWYYIKLRPRLAQFLEDISKIYELHIYTMGTRAYAQNIAKLVDPDRKIFGDRILSRDESGSMVAKNLERLFPIDTNMVVIIDDRGDVWGWNNNLIKVTPFSFFVGIGDINSSFLPKRAKPRPPPKESLTTTDSKTDGAVAVSKEEGVVPQNLEQQSNGDSTMQEAKPTEPEVSAIQQLVSMGGGDNPELLKEQSENQDKLLAAQLEERPLMQKQKKLEEEEMEDESEHARHHLLSDDDNELYFLEQSLRRVHSEFFDTYSRRVADNAGGRVAELRGGPKRKPNTNSDLDLIPDVKIIMKQVKNRVLEGVNIVFSGVIPLDTNPLRSEIVIQAKSFGARIQTSVRGRSTTHVVAARNRTAKVRQAVSRGKGRIKIVNLEWLMACMVQWQKVDETDYLLKTGDADIGRPGPDEEEEENLSESESISSGTKESEDGTESDMDSRRTPLKNNSLKVSTSMKDDGQTDDELEKVAPPELDDPESPVGGTKSDWQEMHDEMREFLASDDDDDSDADSTISSGSTRNNPQKRTHEDMTASDSEGQSDGESRRKKLAIHKSSGLRKGEVNDNGLPTPAVTAEGEDANDSADGSGWSDLEDKDFDEEEDGESDA